MPDSHYSASPPPPQIPQTFLQPFEQITELTDVPEGTIVRVITRLDQTCQEVRDAARVIGDAGLFQKMEDAQTKIKRDIVFAASLCEFRAPGDGRREGPRRALTSPSFRLRQTSDPARSLSHLLRIAPLCSAPRRIDGSAGLRTLPSSFFFFFLSFSLGL